MKNNKIGCEYKGVNNYWGIPPSGCSKMIVDLLKQIY